MMVKDLVDYQDDKVENWLVLQEVDCLKMQDFNVWDLRDFLVNKLQDFNLRNRLIIYDFVSAEIFKWIPQK